MIENMFMVVVALFAIMYLFGAASIPLLIMSRITRMITRSFKKTAHSIRY